MTTIDPARLASILRSLSIKEMSTAANTRTSERKLSTSAPSLVIDKSKQRDKDQLRKNLRERLKRLKTQGIDFEQKAPGVVIKEILLWEFGENIILHPEFNHIATNISNQIHLTKVLNDYLITLVSELVNDG
jgi:hypothetical protein